MAETLDVTWRVTSVDADGKAKITLTIDRVRFTFDGQGSKVDYDSTIGKMPDDPSAKQVGPPLAALAGKEVSITMDPQGIASDFKAPEAFAKALKDFSGVGVEMGEFFSEDGLRRRMCQFLPALSKEEVEKDKAWHSRFEMKTSMGTLKVHNKYTCDGPVASGEKKLEKINIAPKYSLFVDLSSVPDAKPTNAVQKQEAKGSALFDKDAGRLIETSVTQELAMTGGGGSIQRKAKLSFSMKLVP
jgi:hypothetical protein